MTAFPAVAGTMLIDLDPTTHPLPIIGWAHTTGLNVSPLVLGHPGPLVAGEAFLLHTDAVYDPGMNRFFESADEWRDTVAEEEPYRPGTVLSLFAAPVEIKLPVAHTAAAPARTPPQPKDPAPVGVIEWGSKTYKSKSFWAFTPPGEDEFIFMVEGDNPVPKNATKITRDDFYAKRKAGAVERSGKPGDEPELPLESVDVADDEDDDLV